jgi:NitT/TauT family transport system substrate-binding protein
MMAAENDATFEALKRDFLSGIPRRPVAEERADAEKLYGVMARLGGSRLVGNGNGLPPDLYYDSGRNG